LALKIPGSGGFRPRDFSILVLLAEWRDATARQRNRPPRWIVSDEAMRELAQRQPRTEADLGRVPGLEPGTRRSFGAVLLTAVQRGLELPEPELLRPPAAKPLAGAEKSLLKALGAAVAEVATETGIAREVLATQRDLTSLVRHGARPAEHPLLQGWRGGLMGRKLTAVLAPSA